MPPDLPSLRTPKPEPLPDAPAAQAEAPRVVPDAPSPRAQVAAQPGVATRVEPVTETWDDMDKIQKVFEGLSPNCPILQLTKDRKPVDSILCRVLYGGPPVADRPQELVEILDVPHLTSQVDRFITILKEALRRNPQHWAATLAPRLAPEMLPSFTQQVAQRFADIAASSGK